MNVGMIGLGKLGLPVAYAIASKGLNVYGHDPVVSGPPEDCSHEQDLKATVAAAGDRVRFCDLSTVVKTCDVVFVAVQTPHDPRFEGVTPLSDERSDFDYSYLKSAVTAIDDVAFRLDRQITIAVISTVLPGTMRREIVPLLGELVKLVYTPSFIAMGTTIRDFLDPEFVLLGGDDDGKVEAVLEHVYGRIDKPRHVRTAVENAELIKVAYNTFIGLKIAFANTIMEVCHKTPGTDVDEVTGALKLAHRRLISGAYMDGGMGDGGGCHPRDNIALSWLARELDLSHDLFEDVMLCREDQAAWLADLMVNAGFQGMLPKIILGYAYKPGSRITTGSPALLVHEILERRGEDVSAYDPLVSGTETVELDYPAVFLIGCRHDCFPSYRFPRGSVVIDPFRYMPDQPGVQVVRLGQWAPGRTGTSASTSQSLAA